MHFALFGYAKRCCRLVHDHQAGIPVDGAGDRHGLALAAGHLADRPAQIWNLDVQTVEHRLRLRNMWRPIHLLEDAEHPPRWLAAEEDIDGGVQILAQGQVLVDRLDAQARASIGEAIVISRSSEVDVTIVRL